MSILLPSFISAWAYFKGAPWPALVALFIFILAVLVWVSIKIIMYYYYKREKSEQKIRDHYVNFVKDQEKELLDFRYDGEQATEDMNKLLESLAKELGWIGKKMTRYVFKLRLPISFKKKYKLISNAGEDINFSAKKIKNNAEIMNDINHAIRDNFEKFIGKSTCKTQKDKEELKALVGTYNNYKRSAKECIEDVKLYRNATKSLKGQSKHLTAACNEMYDCAGLLIKEISNFSETFDHLEKAVRQKLSQV